jgi:predicted permease
VRRRAGELTGSRTGVRVAAWLVLLSGSLLANAFAAWGETLIRGWRFSWLDLRLGCRMLVRYPGLALTGGLGIAMAVAIGVGFVALFHSRFYPTIPLSEGDRLVGLENWDRRASRATRPSLYDFDLWRAEVESVEDMAAFRTVTRNVIGHDGSVESVQVAEITPSGFRLARVPPLFGRTLSDADAAPGGADVVVIGSDVWASRFGSAPDIVGRTLRLGQTIHTIVGVMPDGFAFPVNHRYWTPLRANGDLSEYRHGAGPSLFVAGRLAAGFDLAAANAELSVIGKRIAAQFPDSHQHLRAEVAPYTYPFAGMGRNAADGFWAMSALVTLILVIVCVNVAVLIYARTATRSEEIALRSALGASRGRIVGQLFAEALVLSAAAATAGLIAVKLGLAWARATLAQFENATFWADYSLSTTALVYFLLITVLAAVITGVVPALRATRRSVTWNLQQFNNRTGVRLGVTWTTLVVVQVSVATAAIPSAIALGWFEVRQMFSVPNFPVEQILFAEVGLDREPPAGRDAALHHAALGARFSSLQAELSRRLDAQPGVVSHAFTLDLPTMGRPWHVAVEKADTVAGSAASKVQRARIDLDFLRTFDLTLLAGRSFRADDQSGGSTDVVLVDRSFVRRVLSGGEALGRRIRYVSDTREEARESQRWYEIVGVVEDIAANPFGRDLVDPRIYHPMRHAEGSGARIAVRIDESLHLALARKLPEIAAAIDPTVQVSVQPLREAYHVQRTALTSAALGIAVALLSVILLSAASIYALMAFTVTQRRREIAIRTALGAQRGRLLRGILGRALRQVAIGVAIGVGTALLVDAAADGGALGGSEGLLLSGTAVVMSFVGLLAALGPARRGLRIDPSEALKSE